MDVLTRKQRHKSMIGNKGNDTKPEILLRKALWHRGIRYRRNYRKLPGSPDIAITTKKIAIFVDGEFWHGYDWENKKERIVRNRDYWIEKIEENIARDNRNDKLLKSMGWIPIHFWTKEVLKDPEGCVHDIEDIILQIITE